MDRSANYFTFGEKMLSFAGLWHTQTYKQRLLRYYIAGFMSLYCVFGQVCQLYESNFDLASAVRLLQVFIPAVCGVALYYPSILHFHTIKKIYSFILQDSQLVDDDTELKIMQTYAYYGNMFTIVATIMIYTHLITNISSSLLRMIRSTNEIRSDLDLYPIISCFDYFSSRETYYYPVIMYQIVTNFVLVTTSVISYANLLTFVLHACARLAIIKYKIYSAFIHHNRYDNVPISQIDLSPCIIDIVKRLARTNKFMGLINTVFEESNLFQTCLAFFLLILDFLCIPILLERETAWEDVLGFTIYIFGTLFIVYLYCFMGQQLIDYSLDVYKEACLIPFYKMSLKTQKILLTTLTMNAKPYAASIGKIYVASHEFCGNLLRTSLSVAMVINSMQSI